MTELKDPLNNRVLNSIPMPYQQPLKMHQLFPSNESADWRLLKDFFKREGKLQKTVLMALLTKAENILRKEPNLLQVKDPITIVGDIHGQYYDLLKLLEPTTGGDPSDTEYLFLGDYVDRGHFSVEVVCLVLALKITYPKTVHLLRGNHECQQITSHFNFRKQCIEKYDQQVYAEFMNLFTCLPIAALISSKFLCVHAGISPELVDLHEIQKLNRFREIPTSGLLCDLMWADPIDNETGEMQTTVKFNQTRGCSYIYGYELCKSFMKPNKLISVIRAHEAQSNGYKMYHWGGKKQFPTVITIFSAPNYCDFYNNKAAVIRLMDNTLDIQQFLENPHPYFLPNFLDLFEWSVPFMAEKITSMFRHLLKLNHKFSKDDEIPIQLIERAELVDDILHMHKKNSQEHTEYVQLNGRTLDKHLVEDKKAREYAHKKHRRNFDKKKEIDSKNEKRPS